MVKQLRERNAGTAADCVQGRLHEIVGESTRSRAWSWHSGVLSVPGFAEIAPEMFWFQLYRLAKNNHALGLDIVRRAEAAGCRTLVLTLDVPVRTTRPREAVTGLAGSFRVDRNILLQIARSPAWAMALWKYGIPGFDNLRAYADTNASLHEVIAFTRREMGGAFTWEEVAKYRDRWKGTLVLKGIMHPQDAEKAVSLGADGVIVSNHGGRQIEALPASIDVLPAIVRQVGKRATVMIDFRRAQRQRRGARLRPRRGGRIRRQGFLVGPRRARRGRTRTCHRPPDPGNAGRARATRRPHG